MKEVTWNPNDVQGSPVLSNGNLTVKIKGSMPREIIRATEGKASGKWYWEVKVDSFQKRSSGIIGIMNSSLFTINPNSSNVFRGYWYNGHKLPENSSYGDKFSTGDIISVLLNLDNGVLEFWKNGISQGVCHTNLFDIDGEKFPIFTFESSSSSDNMTVTANFGKTPFMFKIPDGYKPYAHSEDVNIKVVTMKL